nr:hypothetical protein [Tanacetum cinerariifolium]
MTIKESKDLTSLSLDELIESSDEEFLTSRSEDEEYVMAVRDFKKFFKRRDKNHRAFVGGSWSDSGEEDDEKAKDETCLVAQASNEICLGVDLNELNKKFQEDFCNKNLARNEDAEDANVANPSKAANVVQASPTEQVSRAAILHASPIRMTKKSRTG